MRHSSIISLGIMCLILIGITACSGSETQAPAQAPPVPEVESGEPSPPFQESSEDLQDRSSNQEESYIAPVFGDVEEGVSAENGYPPPGDQTSDGAYPPPADTQAGNLTPGSELPAPNPAYPAPSEETNSEPSQEDQPPPPLKTGLEATDPSTVSLASGELQFVELFAFW